MAYTKLFSEILLSTIWYEPDHVRLVWITMLAMKNDRHEVLASVQGLADMAKVPKEKCEEALGRLSSPDPESRSPEHEGRRIEKIDGGWYILNGEKYRKRRSAEDRKEYMREYMRKYRNKEVNSNVNNVKKNKHVSPTEQNITKHNIYIGFNFEKKSFDIDLDTKKLLYLNYPYIDFREILNSLTTWILEKYQGDPAKNWWPQIEKRLKKEGGPKPKKKSVWGNNEIVTSEPMKVEDVDDSQVSAFFP